MFKSGQNVDVYVPKGAKHLQSLCGNDSGVRRFTALDPKGDPVMTSQTLQASGKTTQI